MEPRGHNTDVPSTSPPPAGLRRVRARTRAVIVPWAVRLFLRAVLIVIVTVAAGATVGRWSFVPVPGQTGGDVRVAHSSLLVTTPVPSTALDPRDEIVANGTAHHSAVYRVAAVDAWTRAVYANDRNGRLVAVPLGHDTQRVIAEVPLVGAPARVLTGTFQGFTLLALALLLLASVPLARWWWRAHHVRRMRADRDALVDALRREVGRVSVRSQPRRLRVGTTSWWARCSAIVVWAFAVLSLTASATFRGTATQTQSTPLQSAQAGLSTPATGLNGSLTTAATTIAPGDLMERPVDVLVSSTTSASLLTGMTLKVSASGTSAPNGAGLNDATNGLVFWVRSCSLPWTEASTNGTYTYSCDGGGIAHDVLGSSLPAGPSPGTCAPAGATVTKLSTLATAQTLDNLANPLVANTTYHFVIFYCFPTAAADTFQDAQATLTFTFAGVQRSGTYK
jgi:spore coat-associated protein N